MAADTFIEVQNHVDLSFYFHCANFLNIIN